MRLHFLGVTQALGLEITLTESPHDFCSALKGDTVSCTVCWLSVPDGAYVVVKRLPMRDGEFEYQIKSLTEPDERVVRESQLRSNPWGNRLGRPATH